MTEEKKQEIEKAKEVKKEPKEILKLCPFISGFILEGKKTALGEIEVHKTTNVAPCIMNKCTMYDDDRNMCKIVLGVEFLSLLEDMIQDNDDEGEETNNEQHN